MRRNRMIGMLETPVGRFGNHLFQANLLHQLGNTYGASVFHRTFLGNEQYTGLNGQFISNFNLRNLKFNYLSIISEKSIPWINVDRQIQEALSLGSTLIIPSGVMGSRFFDVTQADPNDFFKPTNRFKHEIENENEIKIGIHFRGGDFEDWNPRAILPVNYYQKAIRKCQEHFGNHNLRFVLYSDDLSHPIATQIKKMTNCDNPTHSSDFTAFQSLSRCDAIINSPSTFSFWARVLGRDKLSLHSGDWFDYRVSQQDPFWIAYLSNNNDFTKIHYLV